MTPKEIAEELFYKMSTNSLDEDHHCSHYVAKNCALIAVDEMLIEYSSQCRKDSYEMERHLYWNEVKKEIEKL
jgi:hypothetical protein